MNTHERRINRLATKVIIVLVLVFALALTFTLTSDASEPFSGKTKHKTVKRMSNRQLKHARKGNTLYFWKHGKINKRRF